MTEQIMENTMTLDNSLKEYRLAANLSVEEVAVKLNLNTSVIKNIENDLQQVIEEKFYPSIYLRGYLVNFSKLVGLPDIESFAQYQALGKQQAPLKTISNAQILKDRKPSSNKGKWFILLLLLVAVFAIALSWSSISSFVTSIFSDEPEHVEISSPSSTGVSEVASNHQQLTVHSLILNSEQASSE
ncbi:helix-turn-helix domain-containing protein [Psychromonas aquatilis]|uniref:Helix-turn-helix domain-containing protein n=1 Tax=Psychromonas aquatilis TaxID=2005072 RepID=A0ABU9GRC3_9GAMM